MTRYTQIRTRILIMFILLLLGYVYVGYKMHQVQVTRHDELFAKAKKVYTATTTEKGVRGEIFDANKILLAGNVPVCTVAADPSVIKSEADCRKAASYVAGMCGVNENETFEKLMNKEREIKNEKGEIVKQIRRYVILAKEVDFLKAQEMRKEIAARKMKGFIIEDTVKRVYPKNELLANILGFTGMSKGASGYGLELIYNDEMSSAETTITYERARDGKTTSYTRMDQKPQEYGYNVYLTIQEPIQAILEEELDNLMAENKPKAAYAVLADPYTGNILAIAQRPTYNPNDRSTMNASAYRNRVAEDVLEPGSIMKPIVIASALDMGVVHKNDIIDCGQAIWYYEGKRLKDTHPIGKVPLTEVIKQSSNIGTAKVSLMMGKERLNTALRNFGFGSRTGVPFHDSRGIFRKPEKWDALSITRFCIGQGIAVTPLQMVRAYCMLANGGHPVKLRLVDYLEKDGVITRIPIEKGPSVFKDPRTCPTILAMMKTVTEPGGTAERVNIPGYYVAGKTGTAQKAVAGGYSNKYFASFCGFVPAEHPKLVLLVTADEPTGKFQYGGSVSGPTFKRIAERTLKYMHVQPDAPLEQWEKERAHLRALDLERRKRNDEAVRRRREERDAQQRRIQPVRKGR